MCSNSRGLGDPSPALCCQMERLRQEIQGPSRDPQRGPRCSPPAKGPAPPAWPLPKVPPQGSFPARPLLPAPSAGGGLPRVSEAPPILSPDAHTPLFDIR